MAVTALTTDYSTPRKKDIHIMQGVYPLKIGGSDISLSFGKTSNYCTGIQKLVQRFTIALLTTFGSQPLFPNFGSTFVLSTYGRNNVSKATFMHNFNFSTAKVLYDFKEYQKTVNDLPLDEQLDTVQLIDCNVGKDRLDVTIRIIPMTGEDVEFVIPLPTNLEQ